MSDIPIRVENLGKKYVLSHMGKGGHKKYTALRDVLTEAALAPFRGFRRRLGPAPHDGPPADSVSPGSSSREEFWALKDVSFEIKRGEPVGIIGRNGAGKSTLLKLLSRITEPTTGRIELDGKVASLLEVGTGFHPELTGRENIYLNGAILGMKRAEIKGKFDEIVAFAEVEKFLDTPVKHYSSGMYVRLAFAVAAHLEPDVLIVDEVLAVGDSEFQKKCLGKMQSVSEKDGRTVLFVSHNMQAIRQMCQRVIFLRQGKIAYTGDPHAAISAYLGQGLDAASHAAIDLADYPRSHPIEGAVFRRVRFTDGLGQPAACLRLTDVLGVEMDIQAKKPLRQFNLSMAVVHGEGLRVFSEAYSDEHAQPDLGPGEYTLRFQVPMRFFKMESYFLTLAMDENGKSCDSVEGLLMPEIVDENPNLQMESQRWGVLRVPVTWDLIKPVMNREVTGEIRR
jgi:lipopolysaccharide transport system ATP-binding protein